MTCPLVPRPPSGPLCLGTDSGGRDEGRSEGRHAVVETTTRRALLGPGEGRYGWFQDGCPGPTEIAVMSSGTGLHFLRPTPSGPVERAVRDSVQGGGRPTTTTTPLRP